MYTRQRQTKTVLTRNDSYRGERIEDKIKKITNNKEPIKDTVPTVYTERKDGVIPDYDIRTDRFEAAIHGMDVVDKSHKANREQRIGERAFDTMSDTQQAEFIKKFPNSQQGS